MLQELKETVNEKMAISGKKGNSAGTYVVVFITVLIGLVFYNPIVNATQTANTTGRTTDATIVDLVPTLYILLVLGAVALELFVAYKKK